MSVSQGEPRFQLTAVFGAHELVTDADAILAHIEPSSVVFREGIMGQQEGYSISAMYEELAVMRIANGEYDPSALHLVESLITNRLERYADDRDGNNGYFVAMIRGIVQKNCVLIPADYSKEESGELPGDAEALMAEIQRLQYAFRSMSDLPRLVDLEIELEHTLRSNDVLRETAAVTAIKRALGLITSYEESNLVTQDNSIPAFIVYGAAHRTSLPRRLVEAGLTLHNTIFETRGIPPETIVDPTAHEYLDEAELRDLIRQRYLGAISVR